MAEKKATYEVTLTESEIKVVVKIAREIKNLEENMHYAINQSRTRATEVLAQEYVEANRTAIMEKINLDEVAKGIALNLVGLRRW